ncbi:MAG: HAMP domain-containing protein [Candidatus Aminicenantes bacterium]|nr:HAMP domain-containing protein [Candidatus Aminicenantes bacterium]NIM85150.1 HAMP domain-containing protein [Candidatus Aminicenantes bacterium]NIN24660.1 HAMP domain-containing protein [Candidatus Aminicenantes bacterium]NIN48421.1 HAMP domain-containing protein [Candidatus Aminicenantes bacterium]NIN91324.1 HAMP domain-containing protein [Candidatus Aminicenantes bacterium]
MSIKKMSIMRNLSIRNKLIILMLLVSIPALVLGFTIVIIMDIFQLREDLVNHTRLNAKLVGEVSIGPLTFYDKRGTEEILELLEVIPNLENGFVYDENGKLYTSHNISKEEFEPPSSLLAKQVYHEFKGDYLHLSHPIIRQDVFYGTVYLRASTEPLQRSIRSRITSLILVMVGLIVLSYLLALRFQGTISYPILKLAGVTEKISHYSDYSVRVHHEGRDEIDVLYKGFNNMLEQIQVGQKKRDEAEAEQRRLMAQLAEKNKELEQVIYVTSHDLRSPLVNIQGFSQELNFSLNEINSILDKMGHIPQDIKDKIDPILHEDIQESLKYIEVSTSKMDGLLSGLLKLSRVDRMTSTFDSIDMNQLISDMINAFEFQLKEKGVNIRVEQLPPCFGNEMQLNQLFSNLLSNALKYLDPKRPGEISITGKEKPGGDYVVYCVEDNGIGISKEYQKKIFEIFHRLNPDETDGEGLGLTIVNRIVSRHSGSVWVESQPGKGSKFFVSLPTTINN